MAKRITRIVLTGGPAAGQTTLTSRILKEFKQDDGWRVITIPETATELMAGFGIRPFGGCVSMLEFQYLVIADQLHKEQLALRAAAMVPEENVLILYDRAVFDDKAYVSDDEFRAVLASFGKTEEEILAGYDAVLHLVSCAKGAEFAYNFGNAVRYESVEGAREMDDKTIRAWSAHPNLHIIDNSVDFEDKMTRGLRAVYECLGEKRRSSTGTNTHRPAGSPRARALYAAAGVDMMQTYLRPTSPQIVRRVRQQRNGAEYLYFYTENTHTRARMGDRAPHHRQGICPVPDGGRPEPPRRPQDEIPLATRSSAWRSTSHPFSAEHAILRAALEDGQPLQTPPEIRVLREVTGDPAYKNRALARTQEL